MQRRCQLCKGIIISKNDLTLTFFFMYFFFVLPACVDTGSICRAISALNLCQSSVGIDRCKDTCGHCRKYIQMTHIYTYTFFIRNTVIRKLRLKKALKIKNS